MLVLDSDGFIAAFRWPELDLVPRHVASVYKLLREAYGEADRYRPGGAIFADRGWVAVEVEGLKDRRDGPPVCVGLAVLDASSGRCHGLLPFPPGSGSRVVEGTGLLQETVDGRTRIARLVLPEAPG